MVKEAIARKSARRGFRGRKSQVKPPKIKEPRTAIVSFRLRKTEADALMRDLRERPIAMVKSVKQFARKLTVDYVHGRLVYVVSADRQVDPDVAQNLRAAPDCQLLDRRFILALTDYLVNGDNWCRLRSFMIRAGWPREYIERYNQAATDAQRLGVMRGLLKRMLGKLST
jgi:hypothetical protein